MKLTVTHTLYLKISWKFQISADFFEIYIDRLSTKFNISLSVQAVHRLRGQTWFIKFCILHWRVGGLKHF